MATPEEIAWAAGLFEGEGCILLRLNKARTRRHVRLALKSTDRDVVERFAEIIGASPVKGPYSGSTSVCDTPKDIWEWGTARTEEVRRIIGLFMPFFGERRFAKAEKALLILADVEARSPYATTRHARGVLQEV